MINCDNLASFCIFTTRTKLKVNCHVFINYFRILRIYPNRWCNQRKVEKEKVEKRKAHHERLQRQRIKQEELDKYRNNNPHYDIVDCVVSKIDNKTDLPFIYAEDDWIEV